LLTRRPADPDDGWTTSASSDFALAGFLFLVFVAFTLLAMEPLIRYDAYFNLEPPPRRWVPFLHVLDRVGQRAVALPILAVATYLVCRRGRSWRPAVVAACSVFALNLVVLVLKLLLGRAGPGTADPSFFAGGMAYPSGHSANIVLVYGLIAYLVSEYTDPSRRSRVVLWGTVTVLAVTMVVTSVTLNWHWFADLVAGLLVGGIVLELTAGVDRATPDDGPVGSHLRALAARLRLLWPHTSRGPTGHA
jgi:membrane-associated phospholipid phosphatase